MNSKPFPIPVVEAGLLGPGTQGGDEDLAYMSMPKGMNTFTEPVLPEPEAVMHCTQAAKVLQQTLDLLQTQLQAKEKTAAHVSLSHLPASDMQVINQILGEGEVAATVGQPQTTGNYVQIQESVFAGVWRVVEYQLNQITQDYIEVGPIPQVLLQTVQTDALRWKAPSVDAKLAKMFVNVGILLTEIHDKSQNYRSGSYLGQSTHTINLTLLPVSTEDISYLDHQIGTGNVTILSRGYGNCRIVNTRLPNTWRVVYYNSQDTVILNTVEIVDVPEAALAAPEDLSDSQERLRSIVEWLEHE